MFGPGVTHGFRVPPLSTVAVRHRASLARRVLVPKNAPFFAMGPFLERLLQWGIAYDVIEADGLPIGVEACCIPEQLSIKLSERTYSAACRDDPRARFTVIHELGHILLAHTRSFHRDDRRQIQAYEDSEWQANTFATEFLMPIDDIRKNGYRTVTDLQLAYQVSEPAGSLRLKKLIEKGEI